MAGFEKPVFHTTALSVSQNTNFHLRAMFGTLYPEVIKNYQLQRKRVVYFFLLPREFRERQLVAVMKTYLRSYQHQKQRYGND